MQLIKFTSCIFQRFQLLSVFFFAFVSSSDVCQRNGQRYHIWRSYKNKVGHWSARYVWCLILSCSFFIIYFFINPPWSWNAPRYILNMPETRHERVRKKFHILVDGDTIPFPIKSFREMKFPPGYIIPPSLHFTSMRWSPKCWSCLNLFLFPVCSNPKRLEKERHRSSNTNSNPGNPHSVSTVFSLLSLLVMHRLNWTLIHYMHHVTFLKPVLKFLMAA